MADKYPTMGHAIGPRKDSQVYQRFADNYVETTAGYPVSRDYNANNVRYQQKWDKWRHFPAVQASTATAAGDPHLFNTYDTQTFFKNLQESPMYKGLLEGIGRVLIYGTQYMDDVFAKYVQNPLTYGTSVMSGMFEEVNSHRWKYYNEDWSHNKKVWVGTTKEGLNYELDLTNTPCTRNPLFNGQTPKFRSVVSSLNFSREISIKINAREYAQYSQTPEMVAKIGSELMAMSYAVYKNDIYVASKHHYCGVIRAGPPPVHEIKQGRIYGNDDSYGERPHFADGGISKSIKDIYPNPMLERIIVPRGGDFIDREKEGKIIADGLTRIIQNTAFCDFKIISDEYNPAHANRMSSSVSVILDRHYDYDVFKLYYANLNNPEYVKSNVEILPIDSFPRMSTETYATETVPYDDSTSKLDDGGKHWYKLIAMITDDQNPAYYPYITPVSVQSFFHPSEETLTMFTHYQGTYEFKPWFNRKYIFLDFALDMQPSY